MRARPVISNCQCIIGLSIILSAIALLAVTTSWADSSQRFDATKVYFAGLTVNALRVFNLTGLNDARPLTSKGPRIGDPSRPLVGMVSKVISNVGNGEGAKARDHVTRYRAAGLFQGQAFADAPDTYGIDIQMGADALSPPNMSFIGLEIDMASTKRTDCPAFGGPYYCVGMLVTGSSSQPNVSMSEAFSVEGTVDTFHRGYVAVAGIRDFGFDDISNSSAGFAVSGGSHRLGFSVEPNTISESAFSSPGFRVDAHGNEYARSFTQLLRTPKSSGASCQPGQFSDDSNFHYVCVSPDHWKRAPLLDF